MTLALVKQAVFDGIRAAIPGDRLTGSQWAEAYRMVERGARKGPWLNSTVPFLTEIMDAATDPNVRELVFQKPSQVGGSEVAVNIVGYYVHQDPADIIYCAEKQDKATAWTQESLDPTIKSTPVLRKLVKNNAEDNNQHVKRFIGGAQIFIVWASSPAELSSRPVRVIIFDEKAAFKPTTEGDAVKLGEARTKTWDGEELIVKISSPRKQDDDSDISRDYERGDQREFWVPCPSCDEFQTLKFGGKELPYGLKWDEDDPENPWYLCEHCSAMIEEFDKDEMLSRGKWIPSKPFNGVASFKINQIYSPFVRWGRMVVDFLEAKKFKSTHQVWTNTAMGEPWRDEQIIEYADLKLNREPYPAPWPDLIDGRIVLVVPRGVLMLTAGVDIQGDRIEVEIVGWGRDHESWSIDYRIIYGDPAGADIWEELADYLSSGFTAYDGHTFRITAAAVDTGGHHTEPAYLFCKKYTKRRWFAVKGSSTPGQGLIARISMLGSNPKVRVFFVGTDTTKDEIFSFLQLTDPGPGFCHFPEDDRYNEAYLKQLCAEKKVPRIIAGQQTWRYEKVSPSARNEALDVRVYATAARAIMNPDYEAIASRRIQPIENADMPAVPINDKPAAPEPEPQATNVVPFTVRSDTPFGDFRL